MSPLFAKVDWFRNLSDRLRYGRWELDWDIVLPALGVLVAIGLAITWFILRRLRLRERRTLNSPAKLLAELCTAHGLAHRHRQLLTRLSRHHALAQPALLFIEPSLWSAEKLGPTWDRNRSELETLRARLFACP
jgi:hypothetical protein